MMKFITFLTLTILLFPAVTLAQINKDVCYINTHWWSRAEGIGSGNYVLGQFHPEAFDKQTIKSFRHQDSGLIVNVGVEFGDFSAASAGKPIEIRVALAVGDKEQNAFDVVDTVVAGTSYGKRWGRLSVERNLIIGHLIQTFSVNCNDGSKPKKR